MNDLQLLVDAAKKGDKRAFGEIYRRYYDKIRKYCHFNIKQKEEAEDVAQNTFLKAWKALPKFKWEHDNSLQAFFYRIAKNVLIDLSRKKQPKSLEEAPDIPIEEHLLEKIEKDEQKTVVQNMLSQLSTWEQQIIKWRFWDELSYKQIAKRTNMTSEALRVAIHRILKKLKTLPSRSKRDTFP